VKLITSSWFRRSGVIAVAIVASGYLSACSYTYEPPRPCDLPLTVSYQSNVLPILKQQCYSCHSADKYKTETSNTLNMEDFTSLKYYAMPAYGIDNVSYLVGNISHAPGFQPMPKDAQKLSACEIAIIQAWVDAGALNN
jgi:hypothetical protein